MSQKKKRTESRRETASRWPMLFVMGGLLLVGVAAVLLWGAFTTPKASPEVTGSPKLKVDQEKVDLGDVPLGQTVEVSFELTNAGDRQLRFTDVPYVEVAAGC
ncbi:MAG: hypothetical protein HYZ49_11000 [Chloroflexi bacterium]|nr:hypothetical protein [Chloroflexota bacterium]